jgi:hypothetical protein
LEYNSKKERGENETKARAANTDEEWWLTALMKSFEMYPDEYAAKVGIFAVIIGKESYNEAS